MIIKNVIVYTGDKKFTAGGIVVHDDKIESIYTTENVPDMPGEEVVDGQGAYAIPGLIDLHFHGCMGDDFCDNSKEAIENIAKYEASVGVTTIAPATMTLPVEELEDILRTAAEYKKEQNGSVIEPHEDSQEFHEAVLLKHGMTFILQIVQFG